MKVLVVDDNKDVTDLLSRYLKSKGIENTVTNNPLEGLRRIKEQSYDAVLLDISMPDLSGIDIIHTLEREKILKDQKIVIGNRKILSYPLRRPQQSSPSGPRQLLGAHQPAHRQDHKWTRFTLAKLPVWLT